MTEKVRLEEFLRVNHAGERAAQTIYKGQLAVLGNRPEAAEIRHMMAQEQEHLDSFDELLNDYQVRPSLLDPVWGQPVLCWGQRQPRWGHGLRWPAPSPSKK